MTTTNNHVHRWQVAHASMKAPTGPAPEHTMFALLVCACGAVDAFPRCNFDLTTPEFRRDFVAMLDEQGLRLALDEAAS